MSTKYLQGTLVAVGQPDAYHPPRAEVQMTADAIRAAECLPMYERVAIVPVADLELTADERAAMERLRLWVAKKNPYDDVAIGTILTDVSRVLAALARLTGGAK